MNIKEYFTKEFLKRFFLVLMIDFILTTLMFFTTSYLLTGGVPKELGKWFAIILSYAMTNSFRITRNNKLIENVSELTKNNYWKLRNELKRKIDKKRNIGNH